MSVSLGGIYCIILAPQKYSNFVLNMICHNVLFAPGAVRSKTNRQCGICKAMQKCRFHNFLLSLLAVCMPMRPADDTIAEQACELQN